jgi:hypothetical protein
MVAVAVGSRLYAKVSDLEDLPPTLMDEIERFSSTTTKCAAGPDSEARHGRGDEVSKGQRCKTRKEKTPEVRVQVHEAHSTASREPSMIDAAGTFQEGL